MSKPHGVIVQLLDNIHLVFLIGFFTYGVYLFVAMHFPKQAPEQLTVQHPKDTSTYDLYGPVVADTYNKNQGDLPRLAF